jgi:hypothetical protein
MTTILQARSPEKAWKSVNSFRVPFIHPAPGSIHRLLGCGSRAVAYVHCSNYMSGRIHRPSDERKKAGSLGKTDEPFHDRQ